MSALQFTKANRLWLATHPEYDERWVQERIAADPAILGLGELVLKDKERVHVGGGRLDLLLQSPDTFRRYEVELQLGKADETHIIRTIEYWDREEAIPAVRPLCRDNRRGDHRALSQRN